MLFMTDGLATVGQTSEAAIRELAEQGQPSSAANLHLRRRRRRQHAAAGEDRLREPGDHHVRPARRGRRGEGGATSSAACTGPSWPTRALGDRRARRRATHPGADPGPDFPICSKATRSCCWASISARSRSSSRSGATTEGRPACFKFRLPLDQATTRNGFVPRLWASRKIGLLVDAIREQGGTPGVVSLEAKATRVARDIANWSTRS